MRAIIQRVTQASVSVDGEVISSIGKGLCVLLGISKHDTPKEIEYMVRKILNLRVFDDDGQRWKKSVVDKNLEVLCVSQLACGKFELTNQDSAEEDRRLDWFTLQAVLKGNKPDYHLAMGGEQSEAFYQDFLQHMRTVYRTDAIKDGKFGAYMQVNIQNDGPVTISLETPSPKPAQQKQEKGNSGAKAVKDDRGASDSSAVYKNHSSSNYTDDQIDSFDELNLEEKQGSH